MIRETIEGKVSSTIETQIESIETGSVSSSSRLDELGDELDILQVIMTLEEEFGVDIDDDILDRVDYVGGLVTHLEELLS